MKDAFALVLYSEVSVPNEPPFGRLRYALAGVPPQPNSPSDAVSDSPRGTTNVDTPLYASPQDSCVQYSRRSADSSGTRAGPPQGGMRTTS